MRKNLWSLLLATILAMSLTLPAASDPTNAPSPKLKVGMILTLSGAFASAGEDCRKGIEAALAVAGTPLEVIYADSKNDPTTSILEFQRLVNTDKALGIYTHRSSMGMALDPISLRTQIPLLGAVGHKDFAQSNRYAIQIWPRSDDEGRFVAETLIRRGYKRGALIYTEDEWTSSTSEGFRSRYLELGGSLVFDQAALPSEADFRTSLLRIKASAPDVVFANMLLPQLAPVLLARRQIGVSVSTYSNFYVAKQDVVDAVGDALEGVRYVTIDSELSTLKLKLDPNQGVKPVGLTVASYVATLLLAQVASAHPDIQTPRDLYEVLLQQSEVRTPDYVYPIRDRMVQFPLVIEVMRGGKGYRDPNQG